MCGFVALFDPNGGNPELKSHLNKMLPTLVHRGPDGEGIWTDIDGHVGMGHRRLSIIDLSDAASQPMLSNNQKWVVTFNGEIYNFPDIREQLREEGFEVQGTGDTAVLVEALSCWGISAVERFDGMFAFAAYDLRNKTFYVARDPFGEKPAYYSCLRNGLIVVASELRALEAIASFEVDNASVQELLMFQYIGGDRTIYKDVNKLQPGSYLRVDRSGKVDEVKYFHFNPDPCIALKRSLDDYTDELEELLLKSISRRLVSDVPVGAFLSGGVDSSTVCALITKKLGKPLKTFTIGFDNAPESEHRVAREFARILGTEHYEKKLAPDFEDYFLNVGEYLDEPNGDSSCLPTLLLSNFARTKVTVAISGDGGDELFGGYGRYLSTLNDKKNFERFSPGETYYGNRILVSDESFVRRYLGYIDPRISSHLKMLRQEINAARPTLLSAMRKSDVVNYMPGAVLPKVDRMAMQRSLEVRTPFLNTDIAKFAAKIPEKYLVNEIKGKIVLRRLAYRYLPRELIDLPKQGFGVPMSGWAKTNLLKISEGMLLNETSSLRNSLGKAKNDLLLKEQKENFSVYQLWCILVLENWLSKRNLRLTLADEQNDPASDVRFLHKFGNFCFVSDHSNFEKIFHDVSLDKITFEPKVKLNGPVETKQKSLSDLQESDFTDLDIVVLKHDPELLRPMNLKKIVSGTSLTLYNIYGSKFDVLRKNEKQNQWRNWFKMRKPIFSYSRIIPSSGIPKGFQQEGCAVSAPIPVPAVGREVGSNYSVYIDGAQIPFIETSHEELRSGIGTYSIYGGTFYLNRCLLTMFRSIKVFEAGTDLDTYVFQTSLDPNP